MMSGTSTVPKLLIRGCMKAPRVLKMASKSSVVTPHASKLSAMPTTMTSDLKCKTNNPNTSDTTSELKIANRAHDGIFRQIAAVHGKERAR